MKTDVEMIVTDLDGTLLRNDRTISEYSAEVLNKCRERGIKVVFATARPLRTILPYLEQVKYDAVIYHGGAHIIADGRKIGKAQTIPIDTARNILSALQEHSPKRRLSVEIDGSLYANFDVSAVWNYTDFARTDFTDLPDIDADKLLIEAVQAEEEEILPLLTPDIYCQISEGVIFLIMNRNATKLNGLKTLSSYWGIDLKRAAAFGDDYSDMGMLKECGIGVAMGNAIPEVNECADFVADTNDNDGMAKFIEEKLT